MPGEPAPDVPPIAASSTRRFGLLFVITVACWSAAFPFATLLFTNRYGDFEVNFVRGLYVRKHVAAERALERAGGGPRLVVVGGSGALFGIDAELLEANLGVPAVNFATHAGLGTEYVLSRADREVRAGDRVLLCIEYELWKPTPAPAFEAFGWDYATSYDKRFFLDAGWSRSLRALCSVPPADYVQSWHGWSRRRKDRHRNGRGPYNLATLSANGDMRSSFPPSAFPPAPEYPFQPVRGPADAPYLAAFAARARAKGVAVYFTWPNHCRPDGPVGGAPVTAPSGLRSTLDALGFVTLDAPSDTAYPREWHLDTVYHTDPCARRLRTEELVRRLRPHFGLPPAPAEPSGYYILAGGNHRPGPGNTFVDQPGIRVKYLSPAAVSHPDALTPDALVKLCEGGLPVYFDDPTVEASLRGRGWAGAEVARSTATLGEWTRRFDRHLFLIAAVGRADLGAGVPAEVSAAFRGNGAAVAVVGTGQFSNVRRLETGDQSAGVEEWLADVTGADVPDVRVRLRSDASASKACTAEVNGVDLAGNGPGPHVIVIDPYAGIVSDHATFDGPNREAVTWRLSQFVKLGT